MEMHVPGKHEIAGSTPVAGSIMKKRTKKEIRSLQAEIRGDIQRLLSDHKRVQVKLHELASWVMPAGLTDDRLFIFLAAYDLEAIIQDLLRRAAQKRLDKRSRGGHRG